VHEVRSPREGTGFEHGLALRVLLRNASASSALALTRHTRRPANATLWARNQEHDAPESATGRHSAANRPRTGRSLASAIWGAAEPTQRPTTPGQRSPFSALCNHTLKYSQSHNLDYATKQCRQLRITRRNQTRSSSAQPRNKAFFRHIHSHFRVVPFALLWLHCE